MKAVPSSNLIQRLAVVLGCALLASLPLILVARSQAAGSSSGSLAQSACIILDLTGVDAEVGHGHQNIQHGFGNGCGQGSCWSHEKDPETGGMLCAYGRSALLTLGRAWSGKQARRTVSRQIRKGYRRIDVGAGLAGMAITPKGGGVVMSVGSTTAVLSLAAYSDTDLNPTWSGVRPELREDAEILAEVLRKPGCPVNADSCT